MASAAPCRPLTGAWIETPARCQKMPCLRVAPSRGRGSKQRGDADPRRRLGVAPSRGRGSKLEQRGGSQVAGASPPHGGVDRNCGTCADEDAGECRPLTGAWIETRCATRHSRPGSRRPLTGAWIETSPASSRLARSIVAPSRGRGSKHGISHLTTSHEGSPPHGGVDRNPGSEATQFKTGVAPSRGRGSKRCGL